MFAEFHGGGGDRGVHVIGRGNEHGVDLVVELLEQLPVVAKLGRARGLNRSLVEELRVHVAQAYHVELRQGDEGLPVLFSSSAHANLGDLQAAVGTVGQQSAGQDSKGSERTRAFEKRSPGGVVGRWGHAGIELLGRHFVKLYNSDAFAAFESFDDYSVGARSEGD